MSKIHDVAVDLLGCLFGFQAAGLIHGNLKPRHILYFPDAGSGVALKSKYTISCTFLYINSILHYNNIFLIIPLCVYVYLITTSEDVSNDFI